MLIISNVNDLRKTLSSFRQSGDAIAFVPTMGNLHAGHLSLVKQAQTLATKTVVSIFVNPLQFGPNEDLDSYPRTLDADAKQLEHAGVDVLFHPTANDMYPMGNTEHSNISVPALGKEMCGASRPGHFDGVCTVVCKLFNMVQPDHAVFGSKDFQQLAIIRRMTFDLNLPVTIHAGITYRADSGLALSSRNNYLNNEQLTIAPQLQQTLQQAKLQITQGETNYPGIELNIIDQLANAGFKPDYCCIRDAESLQMINPDSKEIVICAAAYLGNTRLIDNVTVTLHHKN